MNYPPTTLLQTTPARTEIDESALRQRARLIEQTMHGFDVPGVVQQTHPGPVVTTFHFGSEAWVNFALITVLGNNLRLALQAESVRIVRIPGASTIGIEVANDDRVPIGLRELIESPEYSESPARLPLALGRDVIGTIVVSDLSRVPHLLIMGATRTELTVTIHAMILSLLYRSGHDHLRMLLIDTTPTALGLYRDVPNLFVPLVVESRIALHALRLAVTEMEARYKTLAEHGVRTLDAYHDKARHLPVGALAPLPYIAIVIAELAELMKIGRDEAEASITRLAQMSRAVGIHLILATQYSSVNVVTGMIKAHFPARISLRVQSAVDSRVIIDSNGAEQLLGQGDMLFLPPGASRLTRIHGPLVTEDEVARVVEFLKQQA